ncbi:GntR family transcriptional regulator [Emergencia timonensis]|uniref:GntR family transcriptional regulator n=1 Tax=Emergencia timonensis TaxID=1776384 RepID=UPI0024958105|nr:GntR family transcriptional regulator [Emergencia timonensis]
MFQIDMTSRKSIYEQVVDNIKELIMTDVLAQGSKLPSVRELSRDLTINPNTVQKAYRELEREGFVYTTAGVGTFACDKTKLRPDPRRIEEIEKEILSALKALQYLGLSHEEAKNIVIAVIEEDRK